MEDVIKDEKGQIMLLTVFLIIIQVVSFTAILNSLILTSNMPTTGLDDSKQQMRDLRLMTELEIKNAKINENNSINDPSNHTKVQNANNNFSNYVNSYKNTVMNLSAARGASVEILLDNLNVTIKSNVTIKYNDGKVRFEDTFLLDT